MKLAYLSHDDCALHAMGPRHPEQPARLKAIRQHLLQAGLAPTLHFEDAPLADPDSLAAVHDSAYLQMVQRRAPGEGLVQLDPDTAMNPHSLDAALRAAGAATRAVDLVMGGEVVQAFCAVRPPGHHAERDRAMGFCIFNNVAVAACHALSAHALSRVAIVDFDVHHGNGTENIVAGDERILFCSTFQHPFYPHSGVDCEAANVVNTPLLAGAGSDEFRAAISEHWLPRLHEFRPELVVVSAGFDAHQEDRMAELNLNEDDYYWVTEQLCDVASQYCSGRLVSCLEGGYDLDALASSVEAHLRACIANAP